MTTCPLCEAAALRHWFSKEGYTYQRCPACGYVTLHPLPSPAVLEHYYRNYITDTTVNESISREQILSSRLWSLCLELCNDNSIERVLDIGCGHGEFLASSPAAVKFREGIEPSESGEHAIKNHGLSVARCPIETYEPSQSFNLITMWDVIEHLHDPQDILKRIRNWLAPGGIFIFSTFNTRGIGARLFKADWSMYAPPQHLCGFNIHNIQILLNKTGLRMNEHRTITIIKKDFLRRINKWQGNYYARQIDQANRNAANHDAAAIVPQQATWKKAVNRLLVLTDLGDGLFVWATAV